MKIRFTYNIQILMALMISLSSCQKEETIIIDTPVDQVITPDQEVAELIKRVALKDGSVDNIIDGASCTSFKLPITVTVNGIELIVSDEEDLSTVEHILDRFDDDEDKVEIFFPVTIIFPDYSEQIIHSEEEFEDLIGDCMENEPDDDIECIDFVYPVKVFVFNTETQLSTAEDIEEDEDLHDLFENLENEELLSFDFPLTLIYPDGENVTVYTNQELEDRFSAAEGICDEDDDNDHNDDDLNADKLKAILMYGEWRIFSYQDDEDRSSLYRDYIFDFQENGQVQVRIQDEIYMGTWYANGDDGWYEIELDFEEDDLLKDLDNDWEVGMFHVSDILLLSNSGENGSSLQLVRSVSNFSGSLENTLTTGSWKVAKYEHQGVNQTDDFNSLLFRFNEDGSVDVTGNGNDYEGNWSAILQGMSTSCELDFGTTVPLSEFNKLWDIVSLQEDKVELFYHGPEYNALQWDILILEKENE